MTYHGHAEFTMPRNYVASDAYSMLEDDEIKARICGSVSRLDAVADDIRAGNKLKARHVILFETLITLPLNPFWCKLKLTAKDFFVKDNQYCLQWKEQTKYIRLFMKDILEQKEEIFKYCQKYYRWFIKNGDIADFPIYKIK